MAVWWMIRSAWTLTILVITLSLMIFFGVVVPLVPRSQWISIALELLVLSGMLLLTINAKITAPAMPRRAYRFLSVWGISLPLLTVYLSNLAQRDSSVLVINVPILILLYAWGIWILRVLENRERLLPSCSLGFVLSLSGMVIFTGIWGWFTLGDWPMMPYCCYMLEKQSLYLGLGLGLLGACLIRPKEDVRRDGSVSEPGWRLRGIVATVILLVVVIFFLYLLVLWPLLILAMFIVVLFSYRRLPPSKRGRGIEDFRGGSL